MVKLSHHDYRFWCANGAFHHHNAVLTLKRHHNLCTNLPPLRLSKSSSKSLPAQVVRAWRCCAWLLVSMLPVGHRLGETCALRCRSLAPDRGGDCRGILQRQQLGDPRPLKCQNIEGQTTRISVMGSYAQGSTTV